jgi:hypothetical protein
MPRRARQERREERHGGGPSINRYQMRQKLVAIRMRVAGRSLR